MQIAKWKIKARREAPHAMECGFPASRREIRSTTLHFDFYILILAAMLLS
jgi:hypothetical protein